MFSFLKTGLSFKISTKGCFNDVTAVNDVISLNDVTAVNDVISLSYLARTDPRDVARVESKTLICTPEQREAIPTPAEGVQGTLGKWQDPDIMMESLNEKFNGCMEGEI